MGEVKGLLNHFIDNNFELEEKGITPIALAIQGEAGMGKTSIIKQLAEERGMAFTKLNIAQLEEVGDLIGYPMTEYECQLGKKVKAEDGTIKVKLVKDSIWMNEKQLGSVPANMVLKQTGNTRMSYAKPSWVPEYNENGNILLLDDYTRGTNQLTTAMMDLIWEQRYVSWSLPKKTTIFLTTNPDNGCYDVQTQDVAKQTRYLLYDVKFDCDAWAKWAEEAGLDGRCINFVMSYSGELFNTDEQGNSICNPRSFVMFANSISSIKNWDDAENLKFINLIAGGCFKDEQGRFGKMFTAFIRNKMHLLIQPKDMLLGGWDKTRQKLIDTVYDSNGQFRPDISSLLERRFANYVLAWLKGDGKTPIATVKQRMIDFIECEQKYGKKLFNADCIYDMVKRITSEKKGQTNSLLYEPKIANVLM